MKVLLAIIIVFILATPYASAQQIQLIAKDKRIAKYQDSLIKYLLSIQQLDKTGPVYKATDYQNKIYVAKHLEFYGPDVLLIKFGNLSSHGWDCWGVLSDTGIHLFTNVNNAAFQKFTHDNAMWMSATIKTYIEERYFSKCTDEKACKVFQGQLDFIKKKLERDTSINMGQVSDAIIFMERLTSIRSRSNGNYAGRYEPTVGDLKNWSKWFGANHDRLYWDDKEKKVKVR